MPRSKTEAHRVWVELEKHNDDAVNVERARLASLMIRRLCPGMTHDVFFWHEPKQVYCRSDEANGYTEQTDNGAWFNLKYLATNEID